MSNTFYDIAFNHLYIHDIMQHDIVSILEVAKKSNIMEGMEHRWNDDVAEYSAAMSQVFLMSVSQVALTWGKENMPQAFWLESFGRLHKPLKKTLIQKAFGLFS